MDYSALVEVYEKLEGTTKRLEKTYYISKLLKKTKTDDLPRILLLLQGQVYPSWDERKIGVASRLIVKAINVATGIDADEVEKEWKETGDLGLVAEKLTGRKKQQTLFSNKLQVKKVFENLQKLSTMEGAGTVNRKVQLIAELLTSASPKEAKYIVRAVLEELRVGVGDGAIRDALVWSNFPTINGIFFKCRKCGAWSPKSESCLECSNPLDTKFVQLDEKKALKVDDIQQIAGKDLSKYEFIDADEDLAREIYNYLSGQVQEAFDISNEFGPVAVALREKNLPGLAAIKLMPGKPIKVMLYQKAKNLAEAFETVGKPAALEYKYDGFRMQIHNDNGKIILYTRRLENVTNQFPDVVSVVKKDVSGKNYILDAEVIGIDPKTKKWMPFQSISQRIKRKYDISDISSKIPVMVNVFDVMVMDGKTLLKEPFEKRRAAISKAVTEVPEKLQLAKEIITSSEKEGKEFYEEALKKGNEGIMLKNLQGIYKPGSRVGYGVKVKPVMESLDLVITGADWGEGKRATWLTSFTIACIDENNNLLNIGKVGTGIKELEGGAVSFQQFTDLLVPLIISEKGKFIKVKPKVVIEVNYEEIQRSPTYSSGFALRFPRVIQLREDKPVEEISTIEDVRRLYQEQK